MSFRYFLLLLFLNLNLSLFTETIWNDLSANIYGYNIRINEGSVITIDIDEKMSVSYKANNDSSGNIKLDFTNGDLDKSFAYAPTGSVETQSITRLSDEFELKLRMKGVVDSLNSEIASVTARKSMVLNGKKTELIVQGRVHLKDISNLSVLSSDIIDFDMQFSTFLYNANDVITSDDIVETTIGDLAEQELVETDEEAVEPGAEIEEEGDLETGVDETDEITDNETTEELTIELTEEKINELLIKHYNMLLKSVY